MRDDRFMNTALAGVLLCLVVLIVQRAPARTPPEPQLDAPEIGRYQLVVGKKGRPVGVHDTRLDQLYVLGGHRSARPLMLPEELVPSVRPVERIAKQLVPPTDTFKQLRDSAMYASSPNVRAWGADQLGLGSYEPEEVVDALIDALQDPEDEVAVAAALSLTRKLHPAALPALREALSHPNPMVVEYAKMAIVAIED